MGVYDILVKYIQFPIQWGVDQVDTAIVTDNDLVVESNTPIVEKMSLALPV